MTAVPTFAPEPVRLTVEQTLRTAADRITETDGPLAEMAAWLRSVADREGFAEEARSPDRKAALAMAMTVLDGDLS